MAARYLTPQKALEITALAQLSEKKKKVFRTAKYKFF